MDSVDEPYSKFNYCQYPESNYPVRDHDFDPFTLPMILVNIAGSPENPFTLFEKELRFGVSIMASGEAAAAVKLRGCNNDHI